MNKNDPLLQALSFVFNSSPLSGITTLAIGGAFSGATTGAFSGVVTESAGHCTARGTTNCANTVATTIASPTLDGLYLIVARVAGSTTAAYMLAARTNGVITSLSTNNVGNISLAISGGTAIQATQSTGSAADVLWSYSVIATT